MFTKMINILKENPRKIVFPEGSDPRILEASAKLLAEGKRDIVFDGKGYQEIEELNNTQLQQTLHP